ncbi:putative zinc metalloprotease [Trichodelitschia bisporula]|uniref:Peptide hydrolase n=1 Tax=Trichodelitschia bisporula TaxID=703511 RepID=A0A6G1I163_9PEZI|nr:putative zinc metalloprotease [Trichodelitschia bisporula]
MALAAWLLLSLAASLSAQTFPFVTGNCSWPAPEWQGVGTAVERRIPDPELQSLLDAVDPARIRHTVEKLVSFGTRHTLSTQTDPKRGIGAARDWIATEMQRYAAAAGVRLTVDTPGYDQGVASRIPFPVRISNVVATLEGTADPSRVYVVAGHYDSRVTDVNDYESDAPGANDDASGVAVVMELCRIISQRPPKATIIFAAVAGEEQGLYGSAFLAQSLKKNGTYVEAMLNNDIVGSSVGARGQRDAHSIRVFAQGPPLTESAAEARRRLNIGGENDSPARELARFIGETQLPEMRTQTVYRLDRYLRGGDHSSFLQQGYAAVRFTEPNEDFTHQHQDVRMVNGKQYGDLPEFIDYDFVARVTRLNLATLWSLASAPGRPRNVVIDTTTLADDSRLRWTRSAESDLKGYEIVWRRTDAPLWEFYRDVGNIGSATLPISKDNVIFGVRAVGRNGQKSPAVMPMPAS